MILFDHVIGMIPRRAWVETGHAREGMRRRHAVDLVMPVGSRKRHIVVVQILRGAAGIERIGFDDCQVEQRLPIVVYAVAIGIAVGGIGPSDVVLYLIV